MATMTEQTRQTTNTTRTAVALGYFDGVHRGHQQVLLQAKSHASLRPVAFTFQAMGQKPAKKQDQKDLFSFVKRVQLLLQMGMTEVVAPPFSEICEMSPEEFVEKILHRSCHAKVVCCGEDFRFGKQAAGDVERLKQCCAPYGIEVEVVPPVLQDGKVISATWIRQCLQEGDIKRAKDLLGFPYELEEQVVSGNHIGRKLGFPTVNQPLADELCLPKFGVYFSEVVWQDKVYPAVTNIGVKPTVQSEAIPLAETHLLQFAGDLYDEVLRVCLCHFHRPEQQFGSLEALRSQVELDRQAAAAYFDVAR